MGLVAQPLAWRAEGSVRLVKVTRGIYLLLFNNVQVIIQDLLSLI